MVNMAQCIALDHLLCKDVDWYFKDNVLHLSVKEKSMVLFTHGLDSAVICSGKSFQVFVWGGYKHTLWQLPHGDAMCVIGKNIRLDYCDGFVSVIEDVEDMVKCELDKYGRALARLLERAGYVVFIAQRGGILSRLPNVITHDEAENRRKLMEYLGQRLSPQSIKHLIEIVDLFT